jgi:chromosome segregation ATPase
MTDVSTPIKVPDVTETAGFLRRFSDLMANGHNAAYLQRAADLLESLSARVSAALDEEQLGRYKYETLVRHADSLEAECDTLRHDVEGHLDITNAILAERDALSVALRGREAELAGLGEAVSRERDGFGTKSAAHQAALAELRAAFDAERLALKTKLDARDKELDQLRRVYEREREELAAKLKLREAELSELGLAFDRAQSELRSRKSAGEDELAAPRADSERERDALREKVAAVPQAIAPDESYAVVPKAALQRARAQFEYLANECIRRGDIPSQVMCELGVHALDRALTADEEPAHLPVREAALDILAPSEAASLASTDPL